MRSEALLLTTLLVACGAPSVRAKGGGDPRVDANAQALQALRATVEQQAAELARLRERQVLTEQRLGLAHWRPQAVEIWTDEAPITLPKRLTRLDAHRARPHKAALPTRGRPYVLSFWATWCKPCTSPEELARLAILRRELRSEGLDLFSVAIDDLAKVRGDRRAATWPYPVWQGDDAHLDLLPEQFVRQVGMGLPLFVVIDARGRLRYYRSKALDAQAGRDLVLAARQLL